MESGKQQNQKTTKLTRTRRPSHNVPSDRNDLLSEANIGLCLAVLDRMCLESTAQSRSRDAILHSASKLVTAAKKQRKQERQQRDRDIAGLSELHLQRNSLSGSSAHLPAGRAAVVGQYKNPRGSLAKSPATNPAIVGQVYMDPRVVLAQQPEENAAVIGSEYENLRSCYVCKIRFARRHHFYSSLCPDCGDFDYKQRTRSADLSGRVAIVTGGRLKIGYQTTIKLLRNGARVIATTRFPYDGAIRFAAEPDFAQWSQRLHLYSLDLRSPAAIVDFVDFVKRQFDRLDILINSAAQTIARPAEFYRHLIEAEQQNSHSPLRDLLICRPFGEYVEKLVTSSPMDEWLTTPRLSTAGNHPTPAVDFPWNVLDNDGQQVDLRKENSWVEELEQTSLHELIETHLVNSFAPFLLITRLLPLLEESAVSPRFVINVSAAEGQFESSWKRTSHPHINMAKASFNMLTRTSAESLVRKQIYMNSVDTGWCSNQFPFDRAMQMKESGWSCPLDSVDGASRIMYPIMEVLGGAEPVWGCYLKDYRVAPW